MTGQPADEQETGMAVSIVIPTFRRHHLLTELVRRCFEQDHPETFAPLEVVVVDNSPERSAASVAEQLRDAYGPNFVYVCEPRPGISHARNTGVARSRGGRIAFIDDDELPEPRWLASLVECMNLHAADAVFGPVFPILLGPTGKLKDFFTSAFTQTSDQPTGAIIRPRSVLSTTLGRKHCYRPMATNNVLFARSRCITGPEPFAPTLGLGGGEDTLFFLGLHYAGAKFVWCREAAVSELIPSERLTTRYVVRRRYRDGQITSSTCLMLRPRRYGRLLEVMMMGASQLLLGSLSTLLLQPFAVERTQRAFCTLEAGAGKIFFAARFRRQAYGAPVSPIISDNTLLRSASVE